MDENKYLILDTRDGYKDLTADVASATPRGGRIEVVFSRTRKSFLYTKENILIAADPKIVETDVAINGHVAFGAERKLLFGTFLKLFFKGSRKPELHHGDFQILNSRLKDMLKYFYHVAQQVKSLPSHE